jgi:hypothetical protein
LAAATGSCTAASLSTRALTFIAVLPAVRYLTTDRRHIDARERQQQPCDRDTTIIMIMMIIMRRSEAARDHREREEAKLAAGDRQEQRYLT